MKNIYYKSKNNNYPGCSIDEITNDEFKTGFNFKIADGTEYILRIYGKGSDGEMVLFDKNGRPIDESFKAGPTEYKKVFKEMLDEYEIKLRDIEQKEDCGEFDFGEEEEEKKENNDEFKYQMLNRLQIDCKEFLNKESSEYLKENRLWAKDFKEQIKEMKKFWNEIKIKPEWLSMEEINKFEREFEEVKNGKNAGKKDSDELNNNQIEGDGKPLDMDQLRDAKIDLGIKTFQTRNSDNLDFHEYSISRILNAIEGVLNGRKFTEAKIKQANDILGLDILGDNGYQFKEYGIWQIKSLLEKMNKD